MDIRNCEQCGKLYIHTGSTLCGDCFGEMEKQFLVVREYIYKNPGMDIETISKDTGVEVKFILQMLREGRLQYKGSGGLKCNNCGLSIDEGYFCIRCRQEIQKRFQEPADGENSQGSGSDDKRSRPSRGNVFHTR